MEKLKGRKRREWECWKNKRKDNEERKKKERKKMKWGREEDWGKEEKKDGKWNMMKDEEKYEDVGSNIKCKGNDWWWRRYDLKEKIGNREKEYEEKMGK